MIDIPANIADENKWTMAKRIASKEGKKDNYAYVMGIYKKMGGKIKKNEKLNKLYESMKSR